LTYRFMDIEQFVRQSLGCWRSQRSAHHLAFRHFEAVESTIEIEALAVDNADVLALCQSYAVDPQNVVAPFRMTWEGTSDWDEEEAPIQGNTVLVPVPSRQDQRRGELLREQGYAETMAAVGQYQFTGDDTFVLTTPYERAAAEEKIWFATPNLRFRVSLIKTSDGTGVVTASFASEVRALN
jgi:phycoerythrin-associated linker protein